MHRWLIDAVCGCVALYCVVSLCWDHSSGQGHAGDSFHLSDHINICVVCGTQRNLRRLFIVPKQFRTHFPQNAKYAGCLRVGCGLMRS